MRLTRPLLAFVHIERCGGTTINSTLSRNFGWRILYARCPSTQRVGIFGIGDLRIALLINPFLKCIAGHPIKPHSELIRVVPKIRYITVLRDPIERYISHYQYRVDRMGESLSFEEFADMEKYSNIQTKKMVGCTDVEKAKEMLDRHFFLVGTTEKMDGFLVQLHKKLAPRGFDGHHTILNAGNKESPLRNSLVKEDKQRNVIIRNNQADIELYRYVVETILPRQQAEYGPSYSEDVAEFRRYCLEDSAKRNLSIFDKLMLRYHRRVFGWWTSLKTVMRWDTGPE